MQLNDDQAMMLMIVCNFATDGLLDQVIEGAEAGDQGEYQCEVLAIF